MLAQSRRRDSQAKRGKVLAVLEDMTRRGDPVSFTAVAKSAGVSASLVYADGIRERIETARAQQNHKPRRDQQTGLTPSAASLATDLQLARAEKQAPHRTRPAQGRPPAATRGPARPALPQSLVERVDELTQHNQQLSGENNTCSRTTRLYANGWPKPRTTSLEPEPRYAA